MIRSPKLPDSLREGVAPEDLICDEAQASDLRYTRIHFPGGVHSEFDMKRCRFQSCTFEPATWQKFTFIDCIFHKCDLANISLLGGGLIRSTFDGSRATGISLSGTTLTDVEWVGCPARLGFFRFSVFKSVHFLECDLSESNFEGANLQGAFFERCTLDSARFSQAKMQGARFSGCSLMAVSGATSMRGAIVSESDLLGLTTSLATAIGIVIE